MKSYLAAKGTPIESSSRDSLISVLSLIPDNFNEAISPRDLRDAIFTTWENSTIRITHSGSGGEYIGIDREDIKSKIFLGKKELSGTKIMSSILLSSDVDVFFYNTKSDSDNHNFKSAFLAGDDPSLWEFSPYIEVIKEGNSLSFRIKNDNGNIVFESSKFLELNSLKIPTSKDLSKMVTSPISLQESDFWLVLDSKNCLGIRKIENHKHDILFTDERKTMIDIGGIKSGSDFKNVPISEVIRQILYAYLPPLISIEHDSIFLERDHINDVTVEYKYTLTKRSLDILSTTVVVEGSKTSVLTKNGPSLRSDGMLSLDVNDSIIIESGKILGDKKDGEFKISISSFDGDRSTSKEISLNFVYPYFYGFLVDEIFNSKDFNSSLLKLDKSVSGKKNQDFLMMGDGFIYIAYPVEYGDVLDILDQNEKSVVDNFSVFHVKNINSPSGRWSSHTYIVYRSNESNPETSLPLSYRVVFN